jgi:hypothetical protein
MEGNATRRESRIPRNAPGASAMAFGRPLAEKVVPIMWCHRPTPIAAVLAESGGRAERDVPLALLQPANADRKRKVSPVPEAPPTKRRAVTRGAGAAASRPAAVAAAAAAKPAAAEDTWDDIAAATGMSINDLLVKKLAFKKAARADDKLKEMQPLVKQLRWAASGSARSALPPLRSRGRGPGAAASAPRPQPGRTCPRRAAGWHLLTANEKAQMDLQQWKQGLEQVKQEQKQAEEAWASRQAEMDRQRQEVEVRPCSGPWW